MRERAALAALALAAVVAWALVPTYPDYDAYHHLVWGRDLLDGADARLRGSRSRRRRTRCTSGWRRCCRSPASHADRLLVLVTVLSLVALVAGAFALGRALFGTARPRTSARSSSARASRSCSTPCGRSSTCRSSRSSSGRRRSRRARPRRGRAADGAARGGRAAAPGGLGAGRAVLAVVPAGQRCRARAPACSRSPPPAPLLWCLVDLAVTGDPLFSLTNTQALSDSLDRERGLANVPSTFVTFLADLARPPVALAGVVGLGLALRRFGARRMAIPLALLGAGALTFVAIGVAGLSLIPRYLTVPAVALCVLAGYAVMGFATLEPGRAAHALAARRGRRARGRRRVSRRQGGELRRAALRAALHRAHARRAQRARRASRACATGCAAAR